MRAIACLGLILVISLLANQSSGQFFTKSAKTSKTIPRMGRRSVPEVRQNGDLGSAHNRRLIDTLIEEYGASLLDALEVST